MPAAESRALLTGTERPDFIFSVTSRRSAAIRATSLRPAAWTTAWLSLTPVHFHPRPRSRRLSDMALGQTGGPMALALFHNLSFCESKVRTT